MSDSAEQAKAMMDVQTQMNAADAWRRLGGEPVSGSKLWEHVEHPCIPDICDTEPAMIVWLMGRVRSGAAADIREAADAAQKLIWICDDLDFDLRGRMFDAGVKLMKERCECVCEERDCWDDYGYDCYCDEDCAHCEDEQPEQDDQAEQPAQDDPAEADEPAEQCEYCAWIRKRGENDNSSRGPNEKHIELLGQIAAMPILDLQNKIYDACAEGLDLLTPDRLLQNAALTALLKGDTAQQMRLAAQMHRHNMDKLRMLLRLEKQMADRNRDDVSEHMLTQAEAAAERLGLPALAASDVHQ